MAKGLKIIYGGGRFGNAPTSENAGGGLGSEDGTDEAGLKILNLLKKNNVNTIDSAKIYGNSEAGLGRLGAGVEHGFVIDTKWPGGIAPPMTTDRVVNDAKDSLTKLKIAKVHVFYIHGPDLTTPFEEQLAGVDQAYRSGAFEKFGLSNFSPTQVQEVYDLAKAKGYVLPTVFQGLYSPVNRKLEDELLPLCRKLGIVFNGYSPLAAGFLVKTRAQIQQGEGRFDKSMFAGLYGEMYDNEPMLRALDEWDQLSQETGINKADLAYRWVCYNSALKDEYGDGMIVGGRLSQLEALFSGLNDGPLEEGIARKVDEIWQRLAPSVPYADNYEAIVGAMTKKATSG